MRVSWCPVEVDDLLARYGASTILDGVHLRVNKGEIRVILGGSGCGKSTLLKHMIGLLRPIRGSVRLLGCDINEADEPQREELLTRIGMVFQNGALLNGLTLHENVALPLRGRWSLPDEAVDEVVAMKLSLVGLGHAASRYPRELSGGMIKRAAMARAMVLDPDVLFCDEPSAGLDPVTAAALDDLLLGLRERFAMAVVVVTHELASIRTIADTVTLLAGGKVVADGTLAAVMADPNPVIRDFFARRAPPAEAAAESVLAALTRKVRI